MGRLSKEEQARRVGMEYAYRLVKQGGIEALEARVGRNQKSFAPCTLSDADLKEFCNRTKKSVVSLMGAVICLVLRDEFEFGKKRMERFTKKFYSYCECIEGHWLSFEDCAQCIKDETGIDLEIYSNDSDMLLNHAELYEAFMLIKIFAVIGIAFTILFVGGIILMLIELKNAPEVDEDGKT